MTCSCCNSLQPNQPKDETEMKVRSNNPRSRFFGGLSQSRSAMTVVDCTALVPFPKTVLIMTVEKSFGLLLGKTDEQSGKAGANPSKINTFLIHGWCFSNDV